MNVKEFWTTYCERSLMLKTAQCGNSFMLCINQKYQIHTLMSLHYIVYVKWRISITCAQVWFDVF